MILLDDLRTQRLGLGTQRRGLLILLGDHSWAGGDCGDPDSQVVLHELYTNVYCYLLVSLPELVVEDN